MGESGQRGRLFGTDGVRGVAGHDLTASLALDLSVAAAGFALARRRPIPAMRRSSPCSAPKHRRPPICGR